MAPVDETWPPRKGLEAYKRGDYAEAAQEWLPLAQQGQTCAQSNLGRAYAYGEGVPHDVVQALFWFTVAWAGSHYGADRRSKAIAKRMPAADVERARRLARTWLKKHGRTAQAKRIGL